MKRVIFGKDAEGRNSVIYSGDLHDAGRGSGFAWAAKKSVPNEVDILDDLNLNDFRLEPGDVRIVRVEIEPGRSCPMHSTPHITDWAVALSGSLTYLLEDGSEVPIEAGDIYVQLGGVHAWRNDGDVPFVMVSVITGIVTDVDVPGGVVGH